MRYEDVIDRLRSMANPNAVEGMARYGINPKGTLGVSIPTLRKLAKQIGKNHGLALKLWESGIHEARILASMVDDPKEVAEEQTEAWVMDFDSWDTCDQVCMNLFEKLPTAYEKAKEWAKRPEEFVKRAGFALMACLAWHDKAAPDEKFLNFLPVIKAGAEDERNTVKKAVSWALRNIGKRNSALRDAAMALAEEMSRSESRSIRWVGKDATRDLSKKGRE
ncbi:MAG: DNA alkylation repair protein [candidate division WOR-3 bacterium]